MIGNCSLGNNRDLLLLLGLMLLKDVVLLKKLVSLCSNACLPEEDASFVEVHCVSGVSLFGYAVQYACCKELCASRGLGSAVTFCVTRLILSRS